MRKSLTTIFLISLLLTSCLCLTVKASSATWLENYGNRELFYWQSNASGQDTFTVYNQTGLNHDSQFYIYNETLSNFEDLRVTLADGTTILNLWNQTTIEQTSIKLWCNFPAANASYYLYWNNLDALNVWNQTAVFIDVIPNLVGAWKINEGSDVTALDYSGNNNNGIINNGAWNGDNLSFNGVNAFINCTTSSVLNPSSISVFADIKLNTALASAKVFAKWGGAGAQSYFLGANSLNAYCGVNNGGVEVKQSTFALSLGAWYHVGFVYDSASKLQIFLNGLDNGTSLTSGNLAAASNIAVIGGQYDAGFSAPFNGTIKNVLVFNSALSSVNALNLASYFNDVEIELGKVFIRQELNGDVSLFGEIEVNPVSVLTVDDAAALAVVFGFIAIALAVAFGVFKRK